MGSIQADSLIGFEQAGHAIRLNRSAALQRAIQRDGFWAAGNEGPLGYNGLAYVAQVAEQPASGEVRVYYCRVGDYGAIGFWRRGS